MTTHGLPTSALHPSYSHAADRHGSPGTALVRRAGLWATARAFGQLPRPRNTRLRPPGVTLVEERHQRRKVPVLGWTADQVRPEPGLCDMGHSLDRIPARDSHPHSHPHVTPTGAATSCLRAQGHDRQCDWVEDGEGKQNISSFRSQCEARLLLGHTAVGLW